jgi:acyl-CoA thioesterase
MSNADERALQIAQTMLSREGTGPAWGVRLEGAREGWAKVSMVIRPDMLNGHGIAHGGMIYSLADTAFAYACNSRNDATVSQHTSMNFLTPGKEGERLTAEAQEVSRSGRTGVYVLTVRGEDGRDVAAGQGLSRTIGGHIISEGDQP